MPSTASWRSNVGRSRASAVAYSAQAAVRYARLSVITVATEIDEGIATARPAAHTAHHGETRRRASRYTGTAVSAKKRAFAALKRSYAGVDAGGQPEDRRENERVERAEAVLVAAERGALALDERGGRDQVAHLVRVDARDVDEGGQPRVEGERGEDDPSEGEERREAVPPASDGSRLARSGSTGRRLADGDGGRPGLGAHPRDGRDAQGCAPRRASAVPHTIPCSSLVEPRARAARGRRPSRARSAPPCRPRAAPRGA